MGLWVACAVSLDCGEELSVAAGVDDTMEKEERWTSAGFESEDVDVWRAADLDRECSEVGEERGGCRRDGGGLWCW